MNTRRDFLKKSILTGAALSTAPSLFSSCLQKSPAFKISLAQWSLNNTIYNGKLTNLEFPLFAKNEFDIHAVEYVNRFFDSTDTSYLQKILDVTEGEDITNLLIMIDHEGDLGATEDSERIQAVENHYKWVDAAKFLGCHSIRVNASGNGTTDDVAKASIDGLGRLAEYGSKEGINILVENHGGYSSNAQWLVDVINKVDNPFCGTLPDFGNFCIEREVVTKEDGSQERICVNEYDRYQGMKELMPYAKGVSAKSHQFDEIGNEIHTDYYKMLEIIKDSGYTGFIGIEYEGDDLPEKEGIIATKKLLDEAIRVL